MMFKSVIRTECMLLLRGYFVAVFVNPNARIFYKHQGVRVMLVGPADTLQ